MFDATNLFELSEDEIDALPFGLISVDHDGNIEQYNRYESRLARLSKERVIGRNFFRDVAPCTAVQEFMGRFQRFVSEDGDAAESFDYVFPFSFGRQHVNITFLRSSKDRQIKILVNRYDD
jgi:photoactive yellow protein